MKKQLLLSLTSLLAIGQSYAQAGFEPIDGEASMLINRLSTLSGKFPDSLHTLVQPLDAKTVANFLSDAKLYNNKIGWSAIDNDRIALAISNVGEWAMPDGKGAIPSSKPAGPFYPTQTDFLYSKSRNFFLSVNPVVGVQYNRESSSNADSRSLLDFTIGGRLKARYKDWLGVDLTLRYVHDQPTAPMLAYDLNRNTVIGGRRSFSYNANNGTFDYFLPTGVISASLIKNVISLNVGYDYLKMGDGMRSLILSDFSGPVGFANIRTKIWKLQYDNIYMKLSPDSDIPGNSLTTNHSKYKFATAHQLSVNIGKRFNLGLYEMVVFNRNDHFEAGYLNPIIFYRGVERALGSPDKVAIGINAKAIVAKGFKVYGQFLLNEFSAKEFFSGNGYMHNKWGGQLGFNYYDAFNIGNLDLQGEINVIRPYTFEHYSTNGAYLNSNFTNNNLPLAHPLGAGFVELIGVAKYRPSAKILLDARLTYYETGSDVGGMNYGNDLSKDYSKDVPNMFGVKMINGPAVKRVLVSLNGSYRLAPNFFFDLGFDYAKTKFSTNSGSSLAHIHSGLRLNLAAKTEGSIRVAY